MKPLPLALGACLWMAGCAGLRSRPYVEAKDTLFVSLPAVPAAVDSSLSPLGWDSGKFAVELRKELRFQLNRKGVATPEDSAGVPARLEVALDHYQAADFAGAARLTTPAGSRAIPFGQKKKGSAEVRDPTIDDIRRIAGKLAEEARVDPRRRKNEPGNFTGLIMIF
jgi:hypothetical protein